MSAAEKGLDALAIATEYIKAMPPAEWQEIRKSIKSNYAFQIEAYWKWLGISLDAFFSDRHNPLLAAENCLSPDFKEAVERAHSRYVLWSVMLFQAEKEITESIQETNFTYPLPLNKRSDFLKAIALEELYSAVALYSQTLYESQSEAQAWERWQEWRKVVKGQKNFSQATLKRWENEDSKLRCDRLFLMQETSPLTCFLISIFGKHHEKLPSFDAWFCAMTPTRPFKMKKFRIVNGDLIRSPERGKGKKTKTS